MRRIRLPDGAYVSGDCFLVTITVEGRAGIFTQPERAGIAITALQQASEKYGVQVFAYCLMPDHIHILAAMPPGASLIQFVRQFKQLSAFRIKRLAGRPVGVWQERFYDHGLRAEEAVEDVANYIWENPVRAGIVERAAEYPYSGSLTFDRVTSGSEEPDLRIEQGLVETRN